MYRDIRTVLYILADKYILYRETQQLECNCTGQVIIANLVNGIFQFGNQLALNTKRDVFGIISNNRYVDNQYFIIWNRNVSFPKRYL